MIVIVESPFAGDVETNIRYGERCLRDCFLRGETPFASHMIYARGLILDDKVPEERKLGMNAGYEFWPLAEKMVLYRDYGVSEGMGKALNLWLKLGKEVEFRTIGLNDPWLDNTFYVTGVSVKKVEA